MPHSCYLTPHPQHNTHTSATPLPLLHIILVLSSYLQFRNFNYLGRQKFRRVTDTSTQLWQLLEKYIFRAEGFDRHQQSSRQMDRQVDRTTGRQKALIYTFTFPWSVNDATHYTYSSEKKKTDRNKNINTVNLESKENGLITWYTIEGKIKKRENR